MSNLMTKNILPKNWQKQGKQEVRMYDLDCNSKEYKEVVSLLSGSALTNLTKILRVQNPYMYGRYLLKKTEYKKTLSTFKEKTLLHATGADKVYPIISENLDWRLVKRSKFGKGVSFSPDAIYANKECSKKIGNERAMIICKVMIKKAHVGHYSLKLPKQKYDTTKDTRNKVIVKYYDDEFYPEYVVYYKNLVVQPYQLRSVKLDDTDTDSDSDYYYTDDEYSL